LLIGAEFGNTPISAKAAQKLITQANALLARANTLTSAK